MARQRADRWEAAQGSVARRAFRKTSEFPNRRHSNCCGRHTSDRSRLTRRYRARHRQKLPRGGWQPHRNSVPITKRNGHQNVEVRHSGLSSIGCPELRDTRTTPERDTRTRSERDARTRPERDTRTTPERYTATTPERDTRTTQETHSRGPGTHRRADPTRAGPGLYVCGPYTGHRRPFSLHYESLPARVKAKGSDRCFTKVRAALTDCTTRFGNVTNCYW
jgi:hypothetical protein